MANTTAEQRSQRLEKLGELERSLALLAKLTEGRPDWRDPMAKIERQFVALSREIRRSVARDAARDNAYARPSASTVTQAMLELRFEAHKVATATTTVSSGLRRIAAAETAEPLPLGGHVAERVCSLCGEGFTSQWGNRSCPACSKSRALRRQHDLERARTRLVPTRLSDAWGQLAEEEAAVMRRILRRGDR